MAERRQSKGQPKQQPRNGRLRIPLPFEDALKAATEVKPPEKPQKPRAKKAQKS